MPLNASNLLRTIPQAQDIGHYEMQNGLLRSNALGNRLREDDIQANALKRQEYQRSIEDANSMREVVKGFGTDTSANLQALLKAGRLGEAQAYQKALDESAKARAAAGKDYADTDGKIQTQQIAAKDQHIAQLAGVNDPQTAVPWVEAGRRSGAFSPEQADRILKGLEAAQSPEEFTKWKAAAMRWAVAPKDQMKQDFDAAKQAEDVRQFGVTSGETIRANQAREANAAGQLAVSRGNLANSQQRLAFDKAAGGTGGSSKATEGERKGAGFYARMVDKGPVFDQYEKTGAATAATAVAGSIPFIGRYAQNKLMSNDQQVYRQAQEDWVRAKLRKESGAVIGEQEMKDEITTYFPEPGDLPDKIAEKARSRKLAEEAMRAEAGRAEYESKVAPRAQKTITVDW